MVKQLLKKFPKFNERQFANVVTNEETWVHYFDPVRKIGNKIWLSKYGRRSEVAERTMSKKRSLMLYSSYVTVYQYKFRCRRAKVPLVGITVMLY